MEQDEIMIVTEKETITITMRPNSNINHVLLCFHLYTKLLIHKHPHKKLHSVYY